MSWTARPSVLSAEPSCAAAGRLEAANGRPIHQSRRHRRDRLGLARRVVERPDSVGKLLRPPPACSAIALFAWHVAPSAFGRPSCSPRSKRRPTTIEPAVLREAEPRMRDFLNALSGRRPPHRRCKPWPSRRKSSQPSSKLETRARSLNRGGARSPVERAYRDALSLKVGNPELAIRQVSGPCRPVRKRRRRAQTKTNGCAWPAAELKRLEKQMADDVRRSQSHRRSTARGRASGLRPIRPRAKDPARRSSRCTADKPWAASLVERARQQLAPSAGRRPRRNHDRAGEPARRSAAVTISRRRYTSVHPPDCAVGSGRFEPAAGSAPPPLGYKKSMTSANITASGPAFRPRGCGGCATCRRCASLVQQTSLSPGQSDLAAVRPRGPERAAADRVDAGPFSAFARSCWPTKSARRPTWAWAA